MRLQDGYALGQGVGEGEFEVAFEANAGSQQASLEKGQVAYIATGQTLRSFSLGPQNASHCSPAWYCHAQAHIEGNIGPLTSRRANLSSRSAAAGGCGPCGAHRADGASCQRRQACRHHQAGALSPGRLLAALLQFVIMRRAGLMYN